MKNITKCLLGLAIVPVSIFAVSNIANAGLVAREWFFGTWDFDLSPF
jgi:Family of unknown function (DUF6006)